MLGLEKVLYDPPHQQPEPEGWFFRSLIALAAIMRSAGALLAMGTSGILLGLAFEPLGPFIPMPRKLGQSMLQSIPDTIMALGISWLLLHYAHQMRISVLGLNWNAAAVREFLVATLAGALALAMVVAPLLLGGFGQLVVTESKIKSPLGLGLLLILLALAAFSEELILRGYVFQTLVQPLHLLGALVMTSGAFAALHWANQGANEYTIMNTFLAGCALGLVLAWRRSLWAAAGAHFGWNLATILFGLNVSGIRVPVMPFQVNWSVDALWTGGDYGPEGGLLCTGLLVLLLLGLIRLHYYRQDRESVPE